MGTNVFLKELGMFEFYIKSHAWISVKNGFLKVIERGFCYKFKLKLFFHSQMRAVLQPISSCASFQQLEL